MVNYEISNIIFLYSINLIYWLLTVFYREFTKNDLLFLKKQFIFNCDGWCMNHIIHYTLLGYFAPNYWKHVIFIGIIFELIEIPLNKVSKYIDSKVIKDTIFNSFGILIGKILFMIYPNNVNLYKTFKSIFV